jgi:hypothetical protein
MTPALLFCLVSQAKPVETFSVSFFQEQFVVRAGERVEYAPLRLPVPTPAAFRRFRRGSTFVVWDDRGLSVRTRRGLRTTQLEGLPVSPKLFPREEIRANLAKFSTGERSRAASTLAGSVLIRNELFLLIQWKDAAGNAWLETLLRLDLSRETPKEELLGRFEGFTASPAQINDGLMLFGRKLTAVTRAGSRWGIATYEARDKTFGFVSVGETLESHTMISEREMMFRERTNYGTQLIGVLDLGTGERKTLSENAGSIRWIDLQRPTFATAQTPRGFVLRNLASGQEVPIPQPSGIRRTGLGIVIWTPLTAPRKALLIHPKDLRTLATWQLSTSP